MSTRANPDWIKAFVSTYDFIEPTDKLLFWAAVSGIAAAVRHNVIVDQISYKLPLNHYIIFVGNAGIRKSSAILQMRQITAQAAKVLGIRYTSQSSSWQAMVDDLQEASTLEVLWDPAGSLQHSYVTAILSEFGSLFKSDDAGMVDFLVDLWDLHTIWSKRARKDGAAIELQRPGINLIGGTTPSWIEDNFRRSLAKGGLGSRIIWVHETKIKRAVPFVDEAAPKDYAAKVSGLVHDLIQIGSLKGVITFDPEARDLMAKWYDKTARELLARDEDDVQAGFISRKQAHAFKLAAILSLSEGNTLRVTAAQMDTAIKIIDGIVPDIEVIFRGFDVTRYSEHIAIVENKIRNMGVKAHEQRVLAQLGRRIGNLRMFEEALQTLHAQGTIFIEGTAPGRTLTHFSRLTEEQKKVAQFTNVSYHLRSDK